MTKIKISAVPSLSIHSAESRSSPFISLSISFI